MVEVSRGRTRKGVALVDNDGGRAAPNSDEVNSTEKRPRNAAAITQVQTSIDFECEFRPIKQDAMGIQHISSEDNPRFFLIGHDRDGAFPQAVNRK